MIGNALSFHHNLTSLTDVDALLEGGADGTTVEVVASAVGVCCWAGLDSIDARERG